MKKFMWRRVVIDKETNNIANENLLGINEEWENKTVIWHSIEQFEHIPQAEVEEMFGMAAPKKIEQIVEVAEGEDKDDEPAIVIREFFDAQNRDKIIPIIKHLESADKVVLAIDNLDEGQVDLDRLNLLVKIWDAIEVAALMTEYNQDKEKETTVWNSTEKYLIDLN